MADLTALAKGLNIAGKSYINRKAQERQYVNQVALEKLKQDSWLRNLMEQNRRYEITRKQMRLQQEKKMELDSQERIAQSYENVEKAKLAHDKFLKNLKIEQDELDAKITGQGYWKKDQI
jgi:patatin-like phospholipase/acyl hydrolase